MQKLIWFITFGLLAFGLHAQEGGSFTLDEALKFALKNNPTIKNAELDIEKAKKKVWETTAMGLPQASVKVGYTHLPTIPEMAFTTPTYGILQPDNKTVLMEYMDVPIKLGVKNSTQIDASVSQLVFSGAYIVGLQASKTFKMLSEQSLKLSQNDVIEGVTNAYALVLILEENKRILKANYENINKTLEEMKAMFEEGFIEDTDVDQLKYTASTIQNAYNNLEMQIEVAYKLLKFQMGIDMDQAITLNNSLADLLDQIDMESLVQSGDISKNMTVQLLETQENLQELNLKREKSSFLPTVVAFYNHQEKTNRADFDFTIPDMIGLNVEIPVFSSWQRMSKVKQAEIELAKTRNSKEQATTGIKMQIDQAQIALKTAWQNYQNESSNLELTKKIYDKTVEKYKEGMASSMQLTQANSQYLSAQSNYFSAVNSVIQAKSKLYNLLNLN